jgi:hypothetical protein
VDSRGTWLRLDPADDPRTPPTSVRLSAVPVRAGAFVAIRHLGDYRRGDEGFSDDSDGMIAVFRKGNQRLRPGIEYQPPPIPTSPTCPNDKPTDVPEDFDLDPGNWIVAQVPPGADNMAFGPNDCFYGDNSDPDGDYGVEITTFPEVLESAVTFQTTNRRVQASLVPRFDVPLAEAAHLGGYDRFNWVHAVTELTISAGGTFGRLSEARCDSSAQAEELCRALSNRNGDVPLPKESSQPIFIVDPIAGGYRFQVEDFGRPFPVRDNRPWNLDEVFGPRGERDGETELETQASEFQLRFVDAPILPTGVELQFITSLAGLKGSATGDLLLTEGGTFAWRFPDPGARTVRLRQLDSIPKPIADRLAQRGVSIRKVP